MTNTTLRVLSYNIYWGGHQQRNTVLTFFKLTVSLFNIYIVVKSPKSVSFRVKP